MDKLRNRLVSIVSFVIMGVALLATITIVIISFAGYSNYVYQEDVKSLDSYELNFNPDSYFIMINCKYDDVGIYYGTQPIKHFKQHIGWDSSIWSGKYENILEMREFVLKHGALWGIIPKSAKTPRIIICYKRKG